MDIRALLCLMCLECARDRYLYPSAYGVLLGAGTNTLLRARALHKTFIWVSAARRKVHMVNGQSLQPTAQVAIMVHSLRSQSKTARQPPSWRMLCRTTTTKTTFKLNYSLDLCFFLLIFDKSIFVVVFFYIHKFRLIFLNIWVWFTALL